MNEYTDVLWTLGYRSVLSRVCCQLIQADCRHLLELSSYHITSVTLIARHSPFATFYFSLLFYRTSPSYKYSPLLSCTQPLNAIRLDRELRMCYTASSETFSNPNLVRQLLLQFLNLTLFSLSFKHLHPYLGSRGMLTLPRRCCGGA